jgi:hypothetical protein
MSEKIKQFLRGIASTIEICPADKIAIRKVSGEERLAKAFERTGKVLERAIDRYASERKPAR